MTTKFLLINCFYALPAAPQQDALVIAIRRLLCIPMAGL